MLLILDDSYIELMKYNWFRHVVKNIHTFCESIGGLKLQVLTVP